MFTGLIEALGHVEQAGASAPGRLTIATPLGAELRPGDSVAVNGVCLTVVAAEAGAFAADLSAETRRVTTLGDFASGRLVNLERPLRADARLGGHFVLGHVDAVGRIAAMRPEGEGYWLEVELPDSVTAYAIPKGSIAIDGISLTIAALDGHRAGVAVVPFTFAHTTLGTAQAGDRVNLEADVLGKYVARLVAGGKVEADRLIASNGR
ncbi:MAG: riboflavin synthase [Vicinamibacterales bacterium]